MTAGSRAALVLVVVLVSTATAAPALAASAAPAGDGVQPQTEDDGESAVNQTLVVDLQEDGDARWTVTLTFELSSRNETEAFDELAADFEDPDVETEDLGLASYERASRLASESTGREMEIRNVSRDSERTGTATNGTGRLQISFTWTSFGRVEGDRFYVDDVFSTDEGPWLERLDENQRLVIEPPAGYEFFDASGSVTIRNGTIQWTGPQEFGPDALSATFERSGTTGPTTPSTPRDDDTATPGDGDDGSLVWAGLMVLGLGLVVVVGYLLVQREDIGQHGGEATTTASAGESESESRVEATNGAGAAASTAEADTEAEDDEAIDAELLSDEERVERLLEQNGGRMKQANIVKETGWSNAKVSQLLSSMEEEGRIDKLRIGRENLISFPDEDVAEFNE